MKFGIGLFCEGKNWKEQARDFYNQAVDVFGDSLTTIMYKVQQYGLHFNTCKYYKDVLDEFRNISINVGSIIDEINEIREGERLIYRFHWFNGMSKDSKIYKNHKDWKWKHIDWKTEEPYSYWAFDIEKQLDYFYEVLDELPKNKVFIDSVQFNYLHYFYKSSFFRNLRNFKELMLAKEIQTREKIRDICFNKHVPVSFNTQVYHRTRFDEMNAYYSDFLTFEITHRCFNNFNYSLWVEGYYLHDYDTKVIPKGFKHTLKTKDIYCIVDNRITKDQLKLFLGVNHYWDDATIIFSYFPLKNISNSELKKIVEKYLKGD